MRELKFRAYTDTLGMSEPFGLGVMPLWIKGHARPMTVWTFPTPEVEVMQFTGLKDKNGVDVYKGDIIPDEDETMLVVVWDDSLARFRLEQFGIKQYTGEGGQEVDGPFQSLGMMDFDDFTRFSEWAVVGGNIHEDTELLR